MGTNVESYRIHVGLMQINSASWAELPTDIIISITKFAEKDKQTLRLLNK